jgi:hypothetical protein
VDQAGVPPVARSGVTRMMETAPRIEAVRVDPGGYGISWNDHIDLSEYELWTNGEPAAGGTMSQEAPASRR